MTGFSEEILVAAAINSNGRNKIVTLRCIHCGLITITNYKPLLKYWETHKATLKCQGTLFCKALTPQQQIEETFKELKDYVNI